MSVCFVATGSVKGVKAGWLAVAASSFRIMAGAAATSTLVVGQIEGETALLTTEAPDLLVCRLPLALLPAGIAVGALPCRMP